MWRQPRAARLQIWRKGEEKSFSLTLGELPLRSHAMPAPALPTPTPPALACPRAFFRVGTWAFGFNFNFTQRHGNPFGR